MDSNAGNVKANSEFMQRYASMLAYRIAGYVSPEAIERARKFNTSQKIAYIQEIRKLLESSNVIKSRLYQFKDADPTFNILRKIYQFLYQDNNEFSQKSYLYLLTQIADLERNGQDCAGQKKDLEELEDAFLAKISRETLKYETILKRSPAKDHILSLLRIKKSHLLGSLAVLILAVTLFSAEFARQKIEEKKEERAHIELQSARQNPLLRAAKFLQLADTCVAYGFIRQLEKIPMPIDVLIATMPYSQKSFAKDLFDSDSTEYRFKRLCQMAVNYTFLEYSKMTGRRPSNKSMIFIKIVDEDDGALGSYSPSTDIMTINDYDFRFGDDANAFVIFSTICHETIHMIHSREQYADISKEIMKYKAKKIPPPEALVRRYGEDLVKFEKFTETEAAIFTEKVLNRLFEGILVNMQQRDFVEQYADMLMKKENKDFYKQGDVIHIGENPEDFISEKTLEIYKNINNIRNALPSLEGELARIYQGKYNDIQSRAEYVCTEMLKGKY